MEFEKIAKDIIKLKERDLELRDKLLQSGRLGGGYDQEMADLHNRNAAELDKIIDSIGYPTIDKVGREGSEAAWLVIQHAIGQPRFMRKCAALLGKAVDEGRASPIDWAYLTDRIAVFEGRPQAFGTQFDWDENGQMSPQPFDDLDKVNRRRQAIGLNTLEEQTTIMRERARNENEPPPPDFRERRRAVDEWRKSVGWI